MTKSIRIVEVDPSGATLTIDPADILVPEIVWLKPLGGSPITISASFSISFTTDPDMGNETTFVWFGADFTLDPLVTFQIQSQSITQTMLDANGAFTIKTVDDAGLNQFIYTPNINTTEAIDGTSIKIDTLPLNRLTGMTAAQIVLADSGNTPTATTVSGDVTISDAGVVTIAAEAVTNAKSADLASGYIKVGNGSNRPADVQMTGDVTMDNAGVTTIADGVVTPAKLSFTTGVPVVAQVSISSASLLTGNTTPIVIVPAIGGATIVPIQAVFSYVDNGVAYTTNVSIALKHDTATSYIATLANALDKTVSYTSQFLFVGVDTGATDTQLVQGQDLVLQVQTGDPAAGDGTATVTVYYVIL